jgi:hypothetical protein
MAAVAFIAMAAMMYKSIQEQKKQASALEEANRLTQSEISRQSALAEEAKKKAAEEAEAVRQQKEQESAAAAEAQRKLDEQSQRTATLTEQARTRKLAGRKSLLQTDVSTWSQIPAVGRKALLGA